MRHHGEAVNESTLGIRECVQDLQRAAVEVRELTIHMQGVNARLKEGAGQFALHGQQLNAQAIALASTKTKLGITWAIMFVMLAAIVGMAFK